MSKIYVERDRRLRYLYPVNVKPEKKSGRPLLSTSQNGKIVVDRILLSLWQMAGGHTQAEMTTAFRAPGASTFTIAAGLACLAEAGLLIREGSLPESSCSPEVPFSATASTVSVVIVSHNGIQWLPACLDSVYAQSYPCVEVILVDNASTDGTADSVRTYYPKVSLIEIGQKVSFASALNRGLAAAQGDYLLPLNQDIILDVGAVALLVHAAHAADIGGVAACLRFLWAPAFLNGLGNQVRAYGWGTDNFIGWLDLGQLESQREVPSVCLAAALLKRSAWEQVGPLDEGFLMYYEDTEWSYRARLLGFKLAAEPRALVFHAFGGQTLTTFSETQAAKLTGVVYGRLRFTTKLLSGWRRILRLASCALQDLAGMVGAVLQLKPHHAAAYLTGWLCWLRRPPQPFRTNLNRQSDVFSLWKEIPHPRIWHGLPELTWEAVCCEYLPLIIAGKTRPLPEFLELTPTDRLSISCSALNRLALLWRGGGGNAVLRHLWRKFRWSLG